MHWDYIAILFLLGLVVPWRSVTRVRAILQSAVTGNDRVALYISTLIFQWVASAIIAWRCFAQGLTRTDVGLEILHPSRQAMAILVLSALLIPTQVLGVRRLANRPANERGLIGQLAEKLLPRGPHEKWLAVLLVFTVAICEEFVYRGFVEGVFQALAGSAAGAFISAGFFGAAHLYQGRRGVVTTFLVGLAFSGVRIWTGSLLPCVVIHLAVDLSAGIASYRMLKPAECRWEGAQ